MRHYKHNILPIARDARVNMATELIERVEAGHMIIGDFQRIAHVLFDDKPPEHAAIFLGGVLKRDKGKRESTGTAIKLIERAFPAWTWEVSKDKSASLYIDGEEAWRTQQNGNAKSPGAALISAALKVRRAAWMT